MSIATNLYRSNLVAQQNDAQAQILKNNQTLTKANPQSIDEAANIDKDVANSNTLAETQAQVATAELDSLNKSKLNYLA